MIAPSRPQHRGFDVWSRTVMFDFSAADLSRRNSPKSVVQRSPAFGSLHPMAESGYKPVVEASPATRPSNFPLSMMAQRKSPIRENGFLAFSNSSLLILWKCINVSRARAKGRRVPTRDTPSSPISVDSAPYLFFSLSKSTPFQQQSLLYQKSRLR